MNGAQHPSDPLAIVEHTQPFSIPEIEEMQRAHEAQPGAGETPPSGDPNDQDWFQLAGRWVRISLEALDHIGHSGGPANMIGSANGSFIFGEVGGEPNTPRGPLSRLTGVHPSADPEPAPPHNPADDELLADDALVFDWVARRRRRKWALSLVSSAALGLGSWALLTWQRGQRQNPNEGPDPTPITISAAPLREYPDSDVETLKRAKAEAMKAKKDQAARANAKAGRSTQARATPHLDRDCVNHRQDAEAAQREGDWAKLELLSQRANCWRSPAQPRGLRLRALFELERYQECVELGADSNSKEVNKWVNNCQRAQR